MYRISIQLGINEDDEDVRENVDLEQATQEVRELMLEEFEEEDIIEVKVWKE